MHSGHWLEMRLNGRFNLVDSDDTNDWMPAEFIRNNLGRTHLDYPLRNRREQSA